MARSKETEEAIALLKRYGAREATPEEYRKEAGLTRLTLFPLVRRKPKQRPSQDSSR